MDRLVGTATTTASIVAMLIAGPPSHAAPTPPARPPLTMQDVFALRRASDAQISPDGRRVAYVREEADAATDGMRHSVRLVDRRGAENRLLADDATGPRWSPDGRRLAYVAGGRLVVTDADRPASREVLRCDAGAGVPIWSPDGRRLAFTAFVGEPGDRYVPPVAMPVGAHWAAEPRIVTKPVYLNDGERVPSSGHVQLFVADFATGSCRRITSGPADAEAPVWTRSGAALLFGSQRGDPIERTYLSARLYRVAADGGPLTQVSPDGLGARSPSLSPDGRSVVFVGARQSRRDYEPGNLYVMDVDGRHVRRIAADLDREVMQPTFAPDGTSVLVAYGDRGVTTLARIGLDGRRRVLVRGMGGDAGYSVARDGTVAYLTGDFGGPADVAVTTPDLRCSRLTGLNDALLADRSVATVEPLAIASSLDHAAVGAWLVTPGTRQAGRRLPLILSIHGGPYGYDDPTWNLEDQLFAAAGYAVLHVNYRGSISYGFAFADRIAADFPGPSYADLMSGVDAAVAAGVADPRRLFVTGGSAGGMLAAWIAGSTDRFKAAVALKPVINQIDDTLLSDQLAAGGAVVGAPPWEAPLRYWRRSPLSLVGNVRTPTLVMVGEDDHRTPVSESQQLYAALQLRRVPSVLVIVPDAGHDSVLATPSRLIAATAITLDWFARHGGEPAPAAMTFGG